MKTFQSNRISYILSFGFHLAAAIILFFFTFDIEPSTDEFVTVGFGKIGNVSMAGTKGITEKNELIKPKEIEQKKEPEVDEKEVELPVVDHEHETPVLTEEEKVDDESVTVNESVKPLKETENVESKGEEKSGDGDGNFGFEIDFGGKGVRNIYSYSLPDYPEGVSKEIDVKLRFTILPDGTVGKIIPLIVGDAILSTASINSLRKWRFEPLNSNQKQIEQTAIIVFPYRLQ